MSDDLLKRTAVVIPFRDRGADPLRQSNAQCVMAHWAGFPGKVHLVSDGRTGDAQFNRSAAYNRGIDRSGAAEVIVFAEADMMIGAPQITRAVKLAAAAPGIVVPFTEYRYLSPADSHHVRIRRRRVEDCIPERTITGGRSIGAINVASRGTLVTVGQWDEKFEGNWYDDDAMKIAFEICAGPTRWVTGPAFHLYHLPGWTGDHLTDADRAATEANKARLELYRHAETVDRVRELTTGAA